MEKENMEYIVSARKYRPLTFDAVVGQTTLTTTLKNAIRSGKLAHAYLFCGPRGVGKTTCARIFARTINCSKPTKNGEACGKCESCKAMSEQRSYNIFELDAASHNGVDDIRELIEQTRIPPQVGKFKVFIIDEVHMLSTAAFNAFLKTLEEPPAHVIFILATTEKHKLLPTIISRCQIYDFERISVQSMVDYLKMVAEKEGYTAEEEALNVIAEKADGAMRDALSIFDQVASYCQGTITYDKTIEDLNVLDAENYFRIVSLALENNSTEIMLLLNNVINKGFDVGNVCQGLASHIRNVMMAKEAPTMQLLEVSAQQKARLVEQAKACPVPFLYKALKILNGCEQNYRQATNKRLLVELTLIQISQITQGDDDSPSSGLRPTQLKPIFTKKTPQEKPEKAASQEDPADLVIHKPAAKEKAPVATKRPKFGTTFAELNATDNETEAGEEEDLPTEDDSASPGAPFTQEELAREWLCMCNRMELDKEMKGLAVRIKHLEPMITTFPEVEIAVENNILMDNVKKIQKRIVSTLRQSLKNRSLALKLRMAEPDEVKPMLTKAQMAEQLKKSNPAMEALFNTFDLELS